MTDSLTLRDLELRTRIGVTDEERMEPQRVLLTIEMTVDTRAAAQTDEVARSIDYAAVAAALKTLEQTERRTLERLAEDAAALVLTRYRVPCVTVTAIKFPPIGTKQVEVRITRPS